VHLPHQQGAAKTHSSSNIVVETITTFTFIAATTMNKSKQFFGRNFFTALKCY
jgi:hypothetical protein